MQKKVIPFLFLLLVSFSFSQEKSIEDVLEKTTSDHLLENIHLHLNKTSFSLGEHVWFTAYVQNQITQLPSFATANLHVGIYDGTGKEVKRKMLHVENGIARGDFSIDSSFVEDKYLVLAWTNHMKNFKKLSPFKKQIVVLGRPSTDEIDTKERIVLEAYPEGGQLVAEAYNIVGVNYSVQNVSGSSETKIDLLDEQANVINANISINTEGYGRVGFMVDSKKKYFLEAVLPNGKSIKTPLGQSVKSAIGLGIDNTGKSKLIAKLIVSSEALSKKRDKTYSLAIVQNNDIFIQDWQVKEDELAIGIERNLLPYGVLTAILFDESQQPISQRMFFNHIENEERVIDLAISHQMNITRDSVELSLDILEQIKGNINISISVLPEETKAYNTENSLVSSFLVKPYINAKNGSKKYMQDFDRYKNYGLDTKLLVEGWGRYDWEERTHESLKIVLKKESGIDVVGKILDADLTKEKQAYFMTVESKAMNLEVIKKDKSFTTNMVLYQNDSLGVSLIGKEGLLRKPNLDIKIGSAWNKNEYDIEEFFKESYVNTNEVKKEIQSDSIVLTLEEGNIVLDEVVVLDNKIRDNKIAINDPIIEGKIITDNEIKRYQTVKTYLRKLGFKVYLRQDEKSHKVIVQSLHWPYSIIPVFIDGMFAAEGELSNMPLSRAKSIIFEKRKFISIKMRENHYVEPELRNKFIKNLIVHGFARPQNYFSPRYSDYSSSMFEKFGAVFWKGNISINSEASKTILVPTLSQNKLKVYIEGMNENGKLISMEKVINLEE